MIAEAVPKNNLEMPMNRIGFQFKIREDKIEEYKEIHQNVWLEMLDALREAGWHNYTLFMREDGLVFGYFESEVTLSEAQARMVEKDVNTRWQKFMAPFTPADTRPDENFVELAEYFHLD